MVMRILKQAGCIGIAFLVLAAALRAATPQVAKRPYREATFEKGQLKYVHGIPILSVAGTPEEIGRQKAVLTVDATRALSGYPQRLLKLLGREDDWPKMVELGRALLPQFPPDHLAEIRAFGKEAGLDIEEGLVGNTMVDTYRGGMGCSSLIVEPARSATGAPLMGRNLDFFTLGMIDQYTLVTVHRPEGKHAFASIGYPGMFGCISGMNDAGLAVAVHEVYFTRDGSPMFNPKGVPYALCFRQILEQCATVDEAEQLLSETPRTTLLNLAVCDRRGGAVLEMTPRNVVLRGSHDGICACTNHFRSDKLAMLRLCSRYSKLIDCPADAVLGLAEIAAKLDAVNQGRLTVQTMIFEPVPLRLHLACGACPASAQPLVPLELADLLRPDPAEPDHHQ